MARSHLRLSVDYDRGSNVLSLSIGKRAPADCEFKSGVLIRYVNAKPCGATVLDFLSGPLKSKIDDPAVFIGVRLDLDAREMEMAIKALIPPRQRI